ncbi:MAG: RNA-binding protein [DPANN group archaeon]|nr:RNA-binding protein [DPANN group archaeon]
MAKLLVKERQVVVPGEELAEGMEYLPGFGAYRMDDHVRAKRLGIVNISGRAIKIIPLSGRYNPKTDDAIIGKVIDITLNGWRIDTNSAYTSLLSLKDGTTEYVQKGADLTRYYKIGDYVAVTIVNVTSQKLIDVSAKGPGLGKLSEGRIVRVNASKVPRIIGKGGSMISLIKEATNCRIMVGQNGIIWISGEPKKESIAAQAIGLIEEKAHLSGLTDEISRFLKEKVK